VPLIPAWRFRLIMTYYPTLWFARVQPLRVSANYHEVDVRIRRSRFNGNINGTIFGGVLYMATDPWYPIMFWQALAREGFRLSAWIKTARIDFKRPATSDVFMRFRLLPDDLQAAREGLLNGGRFGKTFAVELRDGQGNLCATSYLEVVLRATGPRDEPPV